MCMKIISLKNHIHAKSAKAHSKFGTFYCYKTNEIYIFRHTLQLLGFYQGIDKPSHFF